MSPREADRARVHLAHKIAKFITDNDRQPRAFLQAREDPAGGLAEPGVAGTRECKRILNTWMAKCTIQGAGGAKNLPGGEEKKPAFLL